MGKFELNKQLATIQPSPIRSFNDQISSIDGILKLTLGEPDFPTPNFIKEAAIKSISQDLNGYTHSRGLLPLREAISRYLKRKYDLHYRAIDEIIVTVGATEALFATFLTLLNPGDKVIVPAPNYVIYGTQITLAHGEMISVDVRSHELKLTPDVLEQTLLAHPETKALLLNHPCNPTGVSYTRDELIAIADVVKRFDIVVVSDEIYSELTYDTQHVSFASLLPEQTILINGLSKSHSMTGWRSCCIAGPAEYINAIFKVHQATINTPSTQSQYASIAAYDEGDDAIDNMKKGYKERRDYLIARFNQLGFKTIHPDGAFYLFVQVPTWFKGNDFDFCIALAHDALVGVVPGSAFGEAGAGYFRLSYAASIDNLIEAMDRIASFARQYQ